MTRFSVVVPLFNKAEFVVDTVKSILAQEIVDLEVIVIDDGSTDDGAYRLTSITDPRLKVLTQSNGGVSVARNAGIAHARGKFISFLDADDLWSPDHLSRVEELINSDPNAIAWATSYSELGQARGARAFMRKSPCAAIISRRYDQHDFMAAWSRFPFFCTGSITMRASTLQAMQPCFPPGERVGEDQDLWFRLSALGPIRFLSVRTTVFYRRNVSDSLTSANVMAPLPTFLRLARCACQMPPREKRAARHLYGVHLLHVAWTNCLAGRRMAALRFLVQVNPTVRWSYWGRIFICALLPVSVVRAALNFIRRPGVV